MIELKGVTKRYGSVPAVLDVSFKVEVGEILGFLGRNGAGKSTTLNIASGYIPATSGQVLLDGHDILEEPRYVKRRIGYLPEQPPLYPDMTVYDYLWFVADAKAVPAKQRAAEVARVMDKTGVADMAHRLIKNLSKGYRQRVGLAQAILGDPKVIILDEPTVGLDPQQLIEIRDLIRELGRDRTVMLSSHIMQEISAVCDMIIIIANGKLVAEDSPENLERMAEHEQTLALTVRAAEDQARAIVATLGEAVELQSIHTAENGETSLEVGVLVPEDVRERLFYAFADAKCAILSMEHRKQSLEDVFLTLTAEGAPRPEVTQGGDAQ